MRTPGIWRAVAADDSVEITFLGHASFQIASPAGVRAVTDYNGSMFRLIRRISRR
ncbi:MAG TPA: hypothetical protein VGM32_15515 [Rhodopila sp.]